MATWGRVADRAQCVSGVQSDPLTVTLRVTLAMAALLINLAAAGELHPEALMNGVAAASPTTTWLD
jgi:hypothetical protein